MPVVQVTLHPPDDLWHAVQLLVPYEGDASTVILRALEDYVTAAAKRKGHRSGKYRKFAKALSAPVASLHLSARPASALQSRNIRSVDKLVKKSPTDLFSLPNFGNKSLRQVTAKLATLALMPEEDSYRAAIVAMVAATITAAEGGAA